MTRWLPVLLLLAIAIPLAPAASAHGLNVGQLELEQLGPSRYHLSVRFPEFASSPERVAVLPPGCEPMAPAIPTDRRRMPLDGAFLCEAETGLQIEFPWPNSTMLAVYLRDDGRRFERFINSGPQAMVVDFSALDTTRGGAAGTTAFYFELGVEHILTGWDHLLFVTCLLILARGWRRLVWTITAFTAAHSLTLALAVLGWVRLPSAPVELVIALSVVFLAAEILRPRQETDSLTRRAPWIAAFSFGLLHGLGFAGALSEIGLPPGQAPLALLGFNLGVEAGQLVFAAVLLGILALTRRLGARVPARLEFATVVFTGVAASYWVVERAQLLFAAGQ